MRPHAGDTLDFEGHQRPPRGRIEAIRLMPQTADRRAAIARLDPRQRAARRDLRASDAMAGRQVARHPIGRRRSVSGGSFKPRLAGIGAADDKAIVTGLVLRHVPVAGSAIRRPRHEAEIYHNFGYAKPEGYKTLRVMRMATKVCARSSSRHRRPIRASSRKSGVAEVAFNLREMTDRCRSS
jgi:acetyl-CoA carboxylase alpha subunit